MRYCVSIFLIFVGVAVFADDRTYQFKIRSTPKTLATLTTIMFESGNPNQPDIENPVYFKLFDDSTVLFFKTNEGLYEVENHYHYYCNDSGVYRSKWEKLENNYTFAFDIGNVQHQFVLKAQNVRVNEKDTFLFTLYKSHLKRTYVGKAQPFLIPPYLPTEQMDVYPVDAFYKIMQMSEEKQAFLREKYHHLFEKDSTLTDSVNISQ